MALSTNPSTNPGEIENPSRRKFFGIIGATTGLVGLALAGCGTNPNTIYEYETKEIPFVIEKGKSKTINFELAPGNYTMTVYLEGDPALFINVFDDYGKLKEQTYIDENYGKIEIVPIYNDNGYIEIEVTIFNEDYYPEELTEGYIKIEGNNNRYRSIKTTNPKFNFTKVD